MAFKAAAFGGDEIIELVSMLSALEFTHFDTVFCYLHGSDAEGINRSRRELHGDILIVTGDNPKVFRCYDGCTPLDQLGFAAKKDCVFRSLEERVRHFFAGVRRMRLHERARAFGKTTSDIHN